MRAMVSICLVLCASLCAATFAVSAASAEWDTKQWNSTVLNGSPAWRSPAIQLDSGSLRWLSLRAKSVDSSVGFIYWTTSPSQGRQSLVFHMKPDGVTRTYSINLGSSRAWKGEIRSLGVGLPTGKNIEFFEAALLEQPTAPPEIESTFFDLRDAVNRAGHPSALLAVVRNIGGKPATAIELKARVAGRPLPPQTVPSLGTGESITVTWPVQMDAPGHYPAVLEVSGAGLASSVREGSIDITAPIPAVPSAGSDGRPYVPEPKPVSGDYEIGAYYFPGWQTYSKWSVLDPFPEKRPALGYYREGDPEVADWQLKWAAEHGISFFVYDWYWEKGGRQLEHALHEGYMKARNAAGVKFALLWANHNQPGTSSEQDLMDVTKYWIDKYFKRPDYYKVNGKPVVVIFSPDRFTQDMGAAKVKAAFVKMRALAKKAGIPDIYIMACASPDASALKTRKLEGYDATTGYNYPSAGATSPLNAPYDLAVTGYEKIWRQISEIGAVDYVPVADPGWDSRPWEGDQALVRTDPSPEKFRSMLEKAKAFVDAKTPAGRPKMVLVEAWNEFGEGAAIEPSRQFGFGYLDAIRSVFTSAPQAHADVTPADVDLGPYELSPPPAGYLWDFRASSGSLDWAPQNMYSYGVRGGALRGVSSGADPGLYSPRFKLDASARSSLTLTFRVDQGDQAQLFWSTTDRPISEESSQRFDITADGKYHTYTLELGDSFEWAGTITQLRLDPTNAPGADIAVEQVRLD